MLAGCNTMKAGCGQLSAAKMAIPYAGGEGNGRAIGCYVGCLGFNCKPADYSVIKEITISYIENNSKDNAITTSSPGTITFTPTVK